MKLMLACLFKNLNNVISCILLDAQILNYDYKINTINFKWNYLNPWPPFYGFLGIRSSVLNE